MKSEITIKQAEASDVNEIMYFIKSEWNEDHILATDRRFFIYEYLENRSVNFIIAKNKLNEEYFYKICKL